MGTKGARVLALFSIQTGRVRESNPGLIDGRLRQTNQTSTLNSEEGNANAIHTRECPHDPLKLDKLELFLPHIRSLPLWAR